MTRGQRWFAIVLLACTLANLIIAGDLLVYARDTRAQRPFYKGILTIISADEKRELDNQVEAKAARKLLNDRMAVSEANGHKLDLLLSRVPTTRP